MIDALIIDALFCVFQFVFKTSWCDDRDSGRLEKENNEDKMTERMTLHLVAFN